jgi:hypothetical protein
MEMHPGKIEAGLQLARLVDESSQTMTNWKNRCLRQKSPNWPESGVTSEWLESGEGPSDDMAYRGNTAATCCRGQNSGHSACSL